MNNQQSEPTKEERREAYERWLRRAQSNLEETRELLSSPKALTPMKSMNGFPSHNVEHNP